MHPFGGIPICPRCSKQVYAAEQVMGPGRKLYHKPCLACTLCNKRLDSLTLLEHDQLPYCKSCHIKNFGTRDLRHANLPHREDTLPGSPTKGSQPLPLPPRVTSPTGTKPSAPPLLKPTRSLASNSNRVSIDFDRTNQHEVDAQSTSPPGRVSPFAPPRTTSPTSSETISIPSNTGRPGNGNLPRTVPLPLTSPTRSVPPLYTGESDSTSTTSPSPTTTTTPITRPTHHSSRSVGSVPLMNGLLPTSTGTRYGALLNRTAGGINSSSAALSPTNTGSPRRWGGETPACPRCTKNVYFAEQVRAVGKVFHKGCLRCMECSTLLDSSRLRDHDGDPYCVRCYSKLHGPQGSGYALLGKAGG
ncbi:hypothetical protein AMATHDRAFT_41169 [Amanita thiersii Skay4041]|uniref:LIM zinc-binding domain-containing protein n=1 Tax=Amanita thiersii Skay4041 TaxID=703135 RepID=A0A2A9NHB3_9AGAR|nr:hypothetical protein AMATHDRAFT_41169 [Amanita thiersii Skay4041]